MCHPTQMFLNECEGPNYVDEGIIGVTRDEMGGE